MQKTQQKKGFTIIEVVLVLAIAGLILLMVLLAFPALQKNQRDSQRRQDAGQFISQLQSYRTDHKGKLPGQAGQLSTEQFVNRYLPDWKDPLGADYELSTEAEVDNAASDDPGLFFYASNRKCDGTPNTNNAIIKMSLEGGVTCQDL